MAVASTVRGGGGQGSSPGPADLPEPGLSADFALPWRGPRSLARPAGGLAGGGLTVGPSQVMTLVEPVVSPAEGPPCQGVVWAERQQTRRRKGSSLSPSCSSPLPTRP